MGGGNGRLCVIVYFMMGRLILSGVRDEELHEVYFL